ncbi:DUF2723 domain-containing protein [Mucilaginibacter sp. UR6-11]|uniref:glycosyltransferase family 117 protein n=1 Tax=Mucilaginibacter sp. UR6-11 TaxID=1435644 RepID=UPI001E2FB025|nr:DUF2723 domain-containing protein [Mucilaginibacter sp. UR6-11]MCC8425612.1 DUF2723 domain-containing protein [Mucilaginibacter sp. UR6-11]
MQYKKINNLLGWLCFVIASITYILTLEPSVSFWDCGEFISCAFRLQVAHQPGYPLFAMLGKFFSLLSFGNNAKVPYFTNMGSAIASGATIMFLFWTITALAKKLVPATKEGEDTTRTVLIMGAGLVGALAFTYTDTFWFSAVETIVFALSALCTAVVFWAILKWDAHADEPGADKWLIFIAYIIGLSIGIHLLNLLTIPALSLVYYFRRTKTITVKSALLAFLVSIIILGLVQFGIRQWTIQLSAYFDLFFVNTLGLGFGSGSIFFFLLLIGVLVGGIVYSIRSSKPVLNLAFLCVAFVYFGYSSFVYIPIRATANTNLDNSHPDNAFTLNGYLNRIQYGETPLLTGPYFDAKVIDQTDGPNMYRKGATRYEISGKKQVYVYDHTTVFPRIYSTEGQDPSFYRQWLQMGETDVPNFADNLKFFFSWQTYQMYFRYFMWNFAGRVNDADGQQQMGGFKGYVDGDWTTGILDGAKQLPKAVTQSRTYTPLFALPLILGILGLWYHFQRKKRDALIVALLWFFTGMAIVIYVNQPSVQPRERDYSYVGSFYAFAIWIGLGVIALAELLRKAINAKTAAYASTLICLLAVPTVLAAEEWKAHDRSTKMMAHDMAWNYLTSCPPNAILFTYGDNDTYCVWYAQEVENIRPDVRVVNLSLFTGDWYIHQMQRKMNEADALPITMPFDKYKDGVRDVLYFRDAKIPGYTEVKEVFDFISSDDQRVMTTYPSGETANYLPTKNFKITINRDDVIKNNVVPADKQAMIADTMKWKYTSNYVMKDNLAMLDILAHNNWKRPICFATTVGNENLIGMQPYLYKEGFVYHLMPLKVDTAVKDQSGKVNSLVMYNNMMNKFKYGQLKTAKYLDHESTTMFYPVLISTFLDLIQSLIAEGHNDLALKALHKYDEVMPDLKVDMRISGSKFYMAQTAYKLQDINLGTKYVTSINSYITDQLDYCYRQLQANSGAFNPRDVQMGIQLIYAMADEAKNAHQTELYNKLEGERKAYETKFAPIFK